MNGYETRLAAFADGRRLLRLRHPVQNDDGVACDACGSADPRWLHLLKDEATGRYALVGSNCVRALTERGAVRRRYAPDIAEQAYADELAQRQTAPPPQSRATDEPHPPAHAAPPSMPPPAETANGTRLVAAVAMVKREEWANLLEALPLGANRWRFIALNGAASGLEDLIVIGVNASDTVA